MKQNRQVIPTGQDDASALPAWLQDLARQARLAWRLFWDRRVPLWTKLIPPAALAYVLFPADVLPDVAPVLGQLDDIAVLLIGIKLFIELAPPEVVQEHLRALGAHIQEWHVVDEEDEPVVIIEGEYQIKEAEDEVSNADEAPIG